MDKQSFEQNADKKPLSRKPSFKNRKPPEIKQTLTSKYRMLKANPLFQLSLDTNSLNSLPPSVTNLPGNSQISKTDLSTDLPIKQTVSNAGSSLLRTNSVKRREAPKKTPLDGGKKIVEETKVTSEKEAKKTLETKGSSSSVTKKLVRSESLKCNGSGDNNFKRPYSKVVSAVSTVNIKRSNENKTVSTKSLGHNITTHKPRIDMHKHGVNIDDINDHKSNKKADIPKRTVTKPLRRSLSAQHFDRKRGKTCDPATCVIRLDCSHTQSLEDLRPEKKATLLTLNISPIPEEKTNVTFKTPSAYERRSVAFQTPNTSRKSLYFPRSQSPKFISKELHEKLNEWLSKKGKTLGTFHHLKCFGLQSLKELDEDENKENIEVMQDLKKDSYEDLRISTDPPNCNGVTNGNSEVNQKELNTIAKDALNDLHKLILEGYPRDHCEVWLRLIHQKYKNVEEEPQYWECRAAIEQSRGNIGSAVECYKTAIVQGAEINSVDESLDQLLQKFSLLNISTNDAEDKKISRDRARIIKDARNVFKSTIIQFAVQERTLKKKTLSDDTEKKFLVTPVRRSTRRRSAYTSTPGIKMCTTLKDLDSSVKESMDFHFNNALC